MFKLKKCLCENNISFISNHSIQGLVDIYYCFYCTRLLLDYGNKLVWYNQEIVQERDNI